MDNKIQEFKTKNIYIISKYKSKSFKKIKRKISNQWMATDTQHYERYRPGPGMSCVRYRLLTEKSNTTSKVVMT